MVWFVLIYFYFLLFKAILKFNEVALKISEDIIPVSSANVAIKATLEWGTYDVKTLNKVGANILPCGTLALVGKLFESTSSQHTTKER